MTGGTVMVVMTHRPPVVTLRRVGMRGFLGISHLRTNHTTMNRFERVDNIFETEEPFRENYNPERLYNREDELDEYASALMPVVKGDLPKNIFVYGNRGTGKTVATNHILGDLHEAIVDKPVDLTTITIQCRSLDTSYQLGIEIVNELRELRDAPDFSESGHSKRVVFNTLFEELDACGGTILIVLDEIDGLDEDEDDLLYEIPRAVSQGNATECKPGIIGVTNDYNLTDSFAPETLDTLCDEEIQFAPYDPEPLFDILKSRAEAGFRDGVVSDGVLRYCAAISAQESGSARQALRILYKAGEVTRDLCSDDDDLDADSITTDHVDRAQHRLKKRNLLEGIRTLDKHSHLALCAIVDLQFKSDDPVRTRDIYQRYSALATKLGDRELSNRRLFDRLKELDRNGFVISTVQSDGCRYKTYDIDTELETMIDALSEVRDDGIDMITDAFRERAEDANLVSESE